METLYLCQRRGCPAKGKSIRKADLEARFEEVLASVRPAPRMMELMQAMFTKAWALQSEHEAARKRAGKQALADTEKKIAALLDRIVEADSDTVIKAYEQRIAKLEREKLCPASIDAMRAFLERSTPQAGAVLQEELESAGQPRRPFGEMFKLTLQFLRNPEKLWQHGSLEHKRTA